MNPLIFQPHQHLAPFVKCYWTLESSKETTPQKNTIIPDGCMKMIFHYGYLYAHYPENGNRILLPPCFVIGQLTKPYTVEPTGETETFFVCFHPNGFLPFASLPIKEMENTAVSLEQLFGRKGEEIQDLMLKTKTISDRINCIETFLFNQLKSTDVVDHIVQSTIETILTANGQFSIGELSKQNQINRRQLVRKFSSDIGLSPKQLSKTIRLQSTLKKMLNNQVSGLTALAYDNQYYDQAHFIKEFKEFTGLTPKEFYGDHLKMSLIFDHKD